MDELRALSGEDCAAEVESMLASAGTRPSEVLLPPTPDKAIRRQQHQLVKRLFDGRVVADTVDDPMGGGGKCVRLRYCEESDGASATWQQAVSKRATQWPSTAGGAKAGTGEAAARRCAWVTVDRRVATLPYATADLPGIGGRLKVQPRHFRVTELPRVEPTGDGQHILVTVRREGMNTWDVQKMIAEVAGVPVNDVGFAGLKDRHAVTTQTFSVPSMGKLSSAPQAGDAGAGGDAGAAGDGAGAAGPQGVQEAKGEAVRVRHTPESLVERINANVPGVKAFPDAEWHRGKLHRGELRGNAFEIIVSGPFKSAMAPIVRSPPAVPGAAPPAPLAPPALPALGSSTTAATAATATRGQGLPCHEGGDEGGDERGDERVAEEGGEVRLSAEEALAQAQAIAVALRDRGWPNYFGDQRFGRHGNGHLRGLALLAEAQAPGATGRRKRRKIAWSAPARMLVNAVQSVLFNDWLAQRLRLEAGTGLGASSAQLDGRPGGGGVGDGGEDGGDGGGDAGNGNGGACHARDTARAGIATPEETCCPPPCGVTMEVRGAMQGDILQEEDGRVVWPPWAAAAGRGGGGGGGKRKKKRISSAATQSCPSTAGAGKGLRGASSAARTTATPATTATKGGPTELFLVSTADGDPKTSPVLSAVGPAPFVAGGGSDGSDPSARHGIEDTDTGKGKSSDAAAHSPRLPSSAGSPAAPVTFSGPLYGRGMCSPAAGTRASTVEDRVLHDAGLSVDAFTTLGMDGARRPGRLQLAPGRTDLRIDIVRGCDGEGGGAPGGGDEGGDEGGDGFGLRFRFSLPPGCYATVLLREFMKLPPATY